jgi:glycogen debranching enzyme
VGGHNLRQKAVSDQARVWDKRGAEVDDIRLLPGERIVSAKDVPIQRADSVPSAVDALAFLCGAKSENDIGHTGPPVGASVLPENACIPELRSFAVLFGRDSLMASRFVQNRYPLLAEATLIALASNQGVEVDPPSEEEPGRIPHEIRDPMDPIAREITRKSGWQWPYYGSVDSTPLFLSTARDAVKRNRSLLDSRVEHKRLGVQPLAAAIAAAAKWVQRRIQRDGLIISRPAFVGSIENQGWKDSWDAFADAEGKVAEPPIASVELQGLAFDACLDGAWLLELSDNQEIAPSEMREVAYLIRENFLRLFLSEGSAVPIALAVDWGGVNGAARRLDRNASNQGHLLSSTVIDEANHEGIAGSIVAALLSDDLLCGAGIRTLGQREARYRPGAYHNGSSWLWDTAMCGFGLLRYGFVDEGQDLLHRVLRTCEAYGGYPEFARGDSRENPLFNTRVVDVVDAIDRPNRIEQPPQQIQAWTVAAHIAITDYFTTGELPPMYR